MIDRVRDRPCVGVDQSREVLQGGLAGDQEGIKDRELAPIKLVECSHQ